MKNKDTGLEVEATKEVAVKAVKVKKKQKASKSYTLKSFGGNIEKLIEMKFITADEETQLRAIKASAMAKYIENEF